MSTTIAPTGTMHLEKECSAYTGAAGAFCTIVASDFDAIPIGSKVVYLEAANAQGGLDSDIVVETPDGGAANGHVVLDGATQTGIVTLRGGSGDFAALSADLTVAHTTGVNYSWEGSYTA
jgi:hypothetical protein